MINIAIYDDDIISIKRLDAALDCYTVQRNTEYDVNLFIGNEGLSHIEKYAKNIHIALVSICSKSCRDFCIKLNNENPNCRICYYNVSGNASINIANPMWFMGKDIPVFSDKQRTTDMIEQLFNGLKYFGNLLMFDTRQLLYIIPTEEIVYFQSDLKYVNIFCKNGESISVYKKLDIVESALSNVFLRVHKSYIVNKTFIDKIDKANRTVVLHGGEVLPISTSQYTKVLDELSPKI